LLFAVEKVAWAGFFSDLVLLFMTYHSTTAVYLFIQIC